MQYTKRFTGGWAKLWKRVIKRWDRTPLLTIVGEQKEEFEKEEFEETCLREKNMNIYGVLGLVKNSLWPTCMDVVQIPQGCRSTTRRQFISNHEVPPGINLIDRGSTTNSKSVLNFCCKFTKAAYEIRLGSRQMPRVLPRHIYVF